MSETQSEPEGTAEAAGLGQDDHAELERLRTEVEELRQKESAQKQRRQKRYQRVIVQRISQVKVQQMIESPGATATRTLPAGQGVKDAAGVKGMFRWWKRVQHNAAQQQSGGRGVGAESDSRVHCGCR